MKNTYTPPAKKKPGRKPLPPEVKAERTKQSSLNRRGCIVQVLYPSQRMAAEVNDMLGENRQLTLYAALMLYTGRDPRKAPK